MQSLPLSTLIIIFMTVVVCVNFLQVIYFINKKSHLRVAICNLVMQASSDIYDTSNILIYIDKM